MELKNKSIKIAIFCVALQPLIITGVTQLLVNQYFFRPTRLTILTGRRQTSWLFIRVTVNKSSKHLGRGLNSLFPDYNSSALLPPDKKLRGLRNYRDQCVPCEIRARFFSFRHFSCFFPPTFSATFLTADHIHQRLIQAQKCLDMARFDSWLCNYFIYR